VSPLGWLHDHHNGKFATTVVDGGSVALGTVELARRVELLFATVFPRGSQPMTARDLTRGIGQAEDRDSLVEAIERIRAGAGGQAAGAAARLADLFGVPLGYLTGSPSGERVEAQLAILTAIREWDDLRLQVATGRSAELITDRRISITDGGMGRNAQYRPVCLRAVRTWPPVEDKLNTGRRDQRLWRRCEGLVRDLERSVGIPTPLVPEEFLSRLADHRGRPIELRPFQHGEVPDGICGLWIDRSDRDVIGFPTDARHGSHIVLHEVGHMLCGHRGRAAVGDSQLAGFMPDLDPAMIRAVLGRSVYSETEEREAELIASLIMDRAISSAPRGTVQFADLDPVSQRLQRTFGG
jgi:hypothetical protein